MNFCFLLFKIPLFYPSMELINNTPNVPAAVGPYSQAVRSGGYLFCSGQIPINPASGKIEATDIEDQARQVMANIQTLLTAQNLDISRVVKATVFLRDMADFPKLNPIYELAFQGHKPARSTVAVAGLPLGALIEIEVIVELP